MLPLDTKNYFSGTTNSDVMEKERRINIDNSEGFSSSVNSRRIVAEPTGESERFIETIKKESFEPNYEKKQLRAINNESLERESVQPKVHVRISSKVKTLIVVYCLALVALIAMMTLSLTTLSKLNSQEAELNSSIERLYNEIGIANAELAGTELSGSEIIQKALELGMILPEEAARMEIEQLAYTQAQKNSYESTWFDNVCDFFSNLFS